MAGIVGFVTIFGAAGASGLPSLLYLVAFCVVGVALICAAALGFRHIRGDTIFDDPGLRLPVGLALAGAIVATTLTVYGNIFMSANERWAQGIDFMSLGIFLWIPLLHIWAIVWFERAANQRIERPGAASS